MGHGATPTDALEELEDRRKGKEGRGVGRGRVPAMLMLANDGEEKKKDATTHDDGEEGRPEEGKAI